jgi:hypothetical protein
MIFDLSNNIDKNKAAFKLDEFIKDGKVIELSEKKKKRTIKQNSYMHVLFSLLAIELGYTLEETKTVLKRECPFMVYDKEGMKFLKRTRDLNTKELTDFIEWVRNYAGKIGIYLPSSEEYLIDQTSINKEISQNKQYL